MRNIHFKVLHYLEENPRITQKELADKLGISLGAANFCLKALVEVGHIKINNFKKNSNKLAYLYLLTPVGFAEKAILTTHFLSRKIAQYIELIAQYHALKHEIDSIKLKIKA